MVAFAIFVLVVKHSQMHAQTHTHLDLWTQPKKRLLSKKLSNIFVTDIHDYFNCLNRPIRIVLILTNVIGIRKNIFNINYIFPFTGPGVI